MNNNTANQQEETVRQMSKGFTNRQMVQPVAAADETCHLAPVTIVPDVITV